MMFGTEKSTARRADIRKKRPDDGGVVKRMRASGAGASLFMAAAFALIASAMLSFRADVVRYRPGQWVHHDIVSRLDFRYHDEKLLAAARQSARLMTARVYKNADPDPWKATQDDLLSLPDRVKGVTFAELPADLKAVLDAGTLAKIQEYSDGIARDRYVKWVQAYVAGIRAFELVILPDNQRFDDMGRVILLPGAPTPIRTETTFTPKMRDDIAARFTRQAEENFGLTLHPKIVAITLRHLTPTHVLDDIATAEAQNRAEQAVPSTAGDVLKHADVPIVDVGTGGGEITPEDWMLLRAENDAYLRSIGSDRWGERLGIFVIVSLLTAVMGIYVARFQPRIVRNHARAAAIALMMLAMLLVVELAALGNNSIYFFGIAPTILVATILTIAYDQRFAIGIGLLHASLATLALNGDITFFAILVVGVVTCCFMLDDLRTRSKLIEVGGITALAIIAASIAAGLVQFDPIQYIARNCLYAGAAGLAVGFITLGILPFIEKAFRITTSMTLLELADASQPLLRRLSLEAPGTYNHSLQVATLAEEAAEAIGANSLLCRVAAYYHDIGKINKADYFIENQGSGHNRHISLSPNVSLLIIIGHVKDGMEIAREYNLPTSIFPFIQQHHGTTLVEYFYHRACDKSQPDQPSVSEAQYRYPGPKPRSKEIAVLMLADAVESACRAMSEPTASRIETLVHEIAMRRLTDGQFDESDLTMRDLEIIERSLAKSLLGIYHGRIAYPSTANISAPPESLPAAKLA